jgi:PKHD-type hydroxylase
VLRALARNPVFTTAAAPRRVLPPRFNLYKQGMYYGDHVDNALMGGRLGEADDPVRVDMSFTLFVSAPQDYEGGELIISTGFGRHPFKLPAGHMILYPTYYFHRVAPVTRGERLACVSWLQSMVRDLTQREILLDLAILGQALTSTAPPKDTDLDLLDKIRKNLLRMWAES